MDKIDVKAIFKESFESINEDDVLLNGISEDVASNFDRNLTDTELEIVKYVVQNDYFNQVLLLEFAENLVEKVLDVSKNE
ncbi:hypothetical protein BUZ57_06715 [Staphylococcus hyicus]|uniref:Uncharacterized protein n=1 Tax=Staphylococcus hyicus TaxID=1284 RepID=A0A418JIR3_STAHY|nr:hypothetical protein [Staphylococcus hyicus]MCQ9301294.1 hypothetical protein [Staphylococcus hyicus]NJH81888.1 hypothetical protein [Staphylococcus hyicus]RIO45701.1 hypothetical protein BUZ57_06715 [Staphylococcus hyicus]